MPWIRRNRRFGSWAALFALTIQLVVSFGHIHLENIQGTSPVTVAPFQAKDSGSGDVPKGDDRDHAGHDFCAICAALSLTSNSVLPTVASPATPLDHHYKWLTDYRATQPSFQLHFLFQARAPPLST